MGRALAIGSLVTQTILLGAGLSAEELAIDHKPVGCVVAGKHPVLTARVQPAARVARARVYFRAHSTVHWYFVDMKAEPQAYAATLPAPKQDLGSFDYYVEATDKTFVGARTADLAARVVQRGSACRKDLLLAAATSTAKVLVGAAPGAPAMPAGFSSAGVTSLGAGSVAAAPAGPPSAPPVAASASGSSGASTALIVGGVAVAGGATAAVLLAKGDGEKQQAPTCLAQPGEYFEIGLACGSINAKARAGCPMTLQVGVGRWSSPAVADRMLMQATGVIAVDGVNLAVTYEGVTLHQGGGEPDGYGNRARAVWTPTVGTHMLTGYWSLDPKDISRCQCAVTQ